MALWTVGSVPSGPEVRSSSMSVGGSSGFPRRSTRARRERDTPRSATTSVPACWLRLICSGGRPPVELASPPITSSPDSRRESTRRVTVDRAHPVASPRPARVSIPASRTSRNTRPSAGSRGSKSAFMVGGPGLAFDCMQSEVVNTIAKVGRNMLYSDECPDVKAVRLAAERL